MKQFYLLFFGILISSLSFAQTNVGVTGTVDGVYINEIHYDNSSTDVGEFVEIAGPSGTDLTDYTVTLYNGNGGGAYDTINLTGSIAEENNGVGSVIISISGSIQNGNPDGLSLSKSSSMNILFISYEGTFTASNGIASGLNSVDIGVSESNSTPIGYSLEYDEGTTSWVIITDDTPGVFSQGPLLSTKKNQIEDFHMYPNPTNLGYVTISSKNNTEISISLFDVLGKQVIDETITNNILDVSNLKAGVYIMKATEHNALSTKKLVIR